MAKETKKNNQIKPRPSKGSVVNLSIEQRGNISAECQPTPGSAKRPGSGKPGDK